MLALLLTPVWLRPVNTSLLLVALKVDCKLWSIVFSEIHTSYILLETSLKLAEVNENYARYISSRSTVHALRVWP